MTKTTDKHLNNWLDHYKVDTSSPRLSRLEEQIMGAIQMAEAPIFSTMGWKDKIITGLGVCSVLFALLAFNNLTQQTDNYYVFSSSSYGYGDY